MYLGSDLLIPLAVNIHKKAPAGESPTDQCGCGVHLSPSVYVCVIVVVVLGAGSLVA